MTSKTAWPLALLTLAACQRELVCPAGELVCGPACAAVQVDPANCGSCGHACAAGEACRAGSCTDCASACAGHCVAGDCRPDLYVACFSTDDVRGAGADLSPVGAPVAVDQGPISLTVQGSTTWVSHSLAPPTLVGFAPGGSPLTRFDLGGGDLEVARAYGALIFVSNASVSTLDAVDPSRGLVDVIPLWRTAGVAENPHGIAFVGPRAYVALYGDAFAPTFAEGQAIAVADVTGSFSCSAGACGKVLGWISLQGVPGAYDAPGFPFPSGAVTVGSRVFVTLANLKQGAYGYYTDPAGSGRLAVVDTAAGDALSIVDLGAACTNPSGMAVSGATIWVACGSGPVVPGDVSGATPAVGAPVATGAGVVPGSVVLCGGMGYVTDQYSGSVVRFDPAGVQPNLDVAVCPFSAAAGFAFAADVACAPY